VTNLVGQSIGPYTITERLGRGGMADVYKALHRDLSVYRAVKVIRSELVTSEDFRARFQKEAQAVASLRHPNIVQVHDFGAHDNAYYMVMEFIEGRDLKQVLRSEGPVRPVQRAVDLISQVAGALEYAHARGLIHRDIKPENIMITPHGAPILTDFGIAKLITAGTQLTQTGAAIGTPAYMSPEQALGVTDIGPATDIYALTVVLFEMLTGRAPFSADTPVATVLKTLNDPLPMPQSLSPDIGDALQAVIVKGAAKQTAERYASVASMRAALQAAVASDSIRRATRISQTLLRTQSKRRYWHIALPAVAACAAAAGLVYWAATNRPASPSSAVANVQQAATGSVDDEAAIDSKVKTDNAVATDVPVSTGSTMATDAPVQPPPEVANTTPPPATQATVGKKPKEMTRIAAAVEKKEEGPAPAPVREEVVPAVAAPPSEAPQLAGAQPSFQPAASTAGDDQVRIGQTTQSDLLKLFGGPNLTLADETGLDVWVYERVATQTDTRSSGQAAQGAANLGLYFKSIGAGASGAASRSSETVTTSSTVRSLTVTVTFSPDRTVRHYDVRPNYF
jgi:serine/threonine protein kinase